MTTARRGEPTPPIDIAGGGAGAASRWGARVAVPQDVVARLGDACAEVVTDDGDALADAGRDWWPLALRWAVDGAVPARPAVIARPAATAEVAAVLRVANDARVPVTAMAGRSGVCGSSIPAHGGVALDLTGLAGIVDVDPDSLLLDVRAGTFGDVLEDALRAEHDVTLGHWPQSIALSTVGGWLACRSAGQYSTRYGKIEDMVVGLEVVLADGTVVRTGGSAPRAAVGPDLTQLFVGSEGTLGIVTEARLRVHPAPPAERRAAYGFDGFAAGLDACRRVLQRGATPAVLRLYDARESRRNFGTERGVNVLIVLDEGDPGLVDAVMAVVADVCHDAVRLDDGLVEQWLGHRNDVSGLQKAITAGLVVDTTEVAARWAVLPDLYATAVAALESIEGTLAATSHQSHAYTDGACLYFTYAGQPPDGDGDGWYRRAWDAVTEATMRHGGAISHHHGIGINRGRFMPDALGPAFSVLETVKHALDPAGILNPGKLGLSSPYGAPPWP